MFLAGALDCCLPVYTVGGRGPGMPRHKPNVVYGYPRPTVFFYEQRTMNYEHPIVKIGNLKSTILWSGVWFVNHPRIYPIKKISKLSFFLTSGFCILFPVFCPFSIPTLPPNCAQKSTKPHLFLHFRAIFCHFFRIPRPNFTAFCVFSHIFPLISFFKSRPS